MSSLLTAEKLQTLRSVAGPSVPDSKLRAALIRAAGDLNLAASRLLSETPASTPISVPQPETQPTSIKKHVAVQKPSALPKKSPEISHARRLAWRTFYCQHHAEARKAVGDDKKEIDEFIVGLWKGLGSKGREEFTRTIQKEIEAEADLHDPLKLISSTPLNATTSENLNGHGQSSKAGSTSAQKAPVSHEITSVKGTDTKEEPAKSTSDSNSNVAVSVNVSTSFNSEKMIPKARVDKEKAQSEPQNAAPGCLVTNPHQVDEGRTNSGPSSPAKRPRCPEWPRKLAVRLCRGIMLTRGKKLLKAGDVLELTTPPARHAKSKDKKGHTRLVRFLKCGREVGRLAPDLAHGLAPGLQSGFIIASGKVLFAPAMIRMFTEIDLEVTISIKKEAFGGSSNAIEAGLEGDGEGVDAKRVNVVGMMSALKLCEPPSKPDTGFPVEGNGTEEFKSGDPGAVDEQAAEAYYRTVDRINEEEALKYKPPKSLACTLREYQKVGVAWMVAQERHGRSANDPSGSVWINPLWKKRVFPDGKVFFMNSTTGCLSLDSPAESTGGPYGGILADEMGLGKTVQCIACILHDIEDQVISSKSNDIMKFGARSDDEPDFDCSKEGRKTLEGDDEAVVAELTGNDDIHNRALQSDDHSDSGDRRVSRGSGSPERVQSAKKPEVCDNSPPEATGSNKRILRSQRLRGKRIFQDSKEDNDSDFENLNGSEGEHASQSDEIDKPEVTFSQNSGEEWVRTTTKDSRPKRKRPRLSSRPKSALSLLMKSTLKSKASFGGTLIICPTSLVTQWTNQLDQHVVPNTLRIISHYGQNRGDSRSISILCNDVVVTSYGTLAAECSEETADGEESSSKDGPLLQLKWRRIILDEAHTIKSRSTKWARAAYKIKAERRWCVTGTVIHNHVNDVFSLLHFLDVRPWSSWAFWNRGIVSNLESNDMKRQRSAMSLIRDIISSVTLRRKKITKDSKGKCIVQLTKKQVELVHLTSSSQERDFYNALHKRSRVQFDTYLSEGKVMHNYASILELLLRLRQACNHPYLVFAAAPSKDSAVMKDKDKLYKQFMEAGSSAEYVDKVFKDVQSGALGESLQCPLCLDVIDDPVAPKECAHPVCRTCMMESLKRANKCPVCRIPISNKSVMTLPRESRFSIDLNKRWRSSAKIDELLKDVRERQSIRDRSKGNGIGKTVIFSQFTGMLDLVGIALDRESFKWLRIDGSVPQAQRAVILQRFENEEEKAKGSSNILLVSLRAGGVGLNLVAASFAILLDIHWNPQVDAQAQDRIHRHGQTRDVVIKRYIIKDTVEEKLLKVQERKQHIADGALEVATDEDRKQAKLSELKLLFSAS